MIKIPTIQDAMDFAIEVHEGQHDKQGRPYHLHVRKVASGVLEYENTTIIAAILHDVVEDTDYTVSDIRHRFGETVASLVFQLTRDDSVTYGEYITWLIDHGDFSALLIKRSDLLTNMSDLPNHMYSLMERYANAYQLIDRAIRER